MKPAAGGDAVANEGSTSHPDWSRLPDDMLFNVMQALSIADLLSTGAVCSSWRPAYSAVRRVRLPITDASPCLLYSSEANDASTATIYSPSSNIRFDVPLLDPPFRSRHVVGSCHGWIVAADELSNLQALNPLTGAQVDLPPVTTLYHIESFLDEQGSLMYRHYYDHPQGNPAPLEYHPQKLRFSLYHRVFLSCSPAAGSQCIVLLMHMPSERLSFARLGDDRWKLITRSESPDGAQGFTDAVYNDKDGLFYIVRDDASVFTLDLSGPSVSSRKILPTMLDLGYSTNYIFLTPAGEIFQLWRYVDVQTVADPVPGFPEFDDAGTSPYDAWRTRKMELYKVDLAGRKLVRIDTLENYAFFMGFSSTLLLSTKDFPGLKSECAYFTDDHNTDGDYIHINEFITRDIGIWNFKTDTLVDGELSGHPWLNFPSPIWMTPSLT